MLTNITSKPEAQNALDPQCVGHVCRSACLQHDHTSVHNVSELCAVTAVRRWNITASQLAPTGVTVCPGPLELDCGHGGRSEHGALTCSKNDTSAAVPYRRAAARRLALQGGFFTAANAGVAQ